MDNIFAHQIFIAVKNLAHDGYSFILSDIILQSNKLIQIAMWTVLSNQKIIFIGFIGVDTPDDIGVIQS